MGQNGTKWDKIHTVFEQNAFKENAQFNRDKNKNT